MKRRKAREGTIVILLTSGGQVHSVGKSSCPGMLLGFIRGTVAMLMIILEHSEKIIQPLVLSTHSLSTKFMRTPGGS